MKRRALVAAIAAVALAACGGTAAPAALPDVEVSKLDGATISLTEIDAPAIINVWATTCAPCVREMPLLQATAADHDDIAIVGLNSAETPDAVRTFVADLGVEYPQLLDQAGYASEVLRVTSLPTTFAIDADGTIVETIRGEMDQADLDRLITAALG